MRMRLGTLKRIIREAVEEVMADPAGAAGTSSAPAANVQFESTGTFRDLTAEQYEEIVEDVYYSLENANQGMQLKDVEVIAEVLEGLDVYTRDILNYLNQLTTQGRKDDAIAVAVAAKHELKLNKTIQQSQVKSVLRDIKKGLTPKIAEQAFEDAVTRREEYFKANPPASSGGPGKGTPLNWQDPLGPSRTLD